MTVTTGRRPRLFYGWWVTAVASLVAGVGSINLMGFTVFFLPLSQELGISRAVTALVSSVARLEGGALGPVAGWAMDRLGARRILVFGCLVGGLGFVLLGTAVHSVWALFLVYGLVLGIGFNTGFFPAALATVNVWFVRRRTVAMGIINASWAAAAFVLVPVLSFLVVHFNWRVAAVFAGGLILITAVPALLVVRRSPESMGLLPDGDTQPAQPPAAHPVARYAPGAYADATVREALRTPAFWLLALGTNLRMVAYSPVLVHFVPLLVWKGLSQQGAGNLIGLWSLLVVPAALTAGYFGDQINKKALISAGMLMGSGAYLMLSFAEAPAYLYLFVVLLAAFDNVGLWSWSLLGQYFGRRNFATLRGIMSGTGSVGMALSPVYAGWVYDRTESYVLALVPFAGCLVASAIVYALLPTPKPRAVVSSPTVGTAA